VIEVRYIGRHGSEWQARHLRLTAEHVAEHLRRACQRRSALELRGETYLARWGVC
jgi:hypothetical protein